MNFILQILVSYLLLYKYVTIFLVAVSAALIIPIPSGSILMASSALAHAGYFNIFWVIFISIVGNILGDNMGYWIAKRYGIGVLSRVGFRRIIESKNFKNLETKFNIHPGFIIFISRFEVLSTLSINLLSGISKTPYKKYFIHEFFGSIAQVCTYSFIGYFFVDSWESINTTIGRVILVVGIIVVILIIFFGKKLIKQVIDKPTIK